MIVKCTRRCNLACRYCLDAGDDRGPDLSFARLAELFRSLGHLPSESTAQIIWHGGEPLLLGKDYFRKALYLESRLVPEGVSIRHSLQTNATLLDQGWIELFEQSGIQVGVSLDGPAEIHDRNRPMRGGCGSHSRTCAGIELLRSSSIQWGVLTVINQNVLEGGARSLWSWFKEHGISKVALLPLNAEYPTRQEQISYRHAYGEFCSEFQECWLEEDDPQIEVRELQGAIDRLLGLPSRCCRQGGACVGRYFGIEPDGTVFHCDKFCDQPKWQLGDLEDPPWHCPDQRGDLAELQAAESRLRAACHDCRWWEYCGGGCLAETTQLVQSGGRLGTKDCAEFRLLEDTAQFLGKSPALLKLAFGASE